jgi:4-hydroxy-tetrahydrodipicolinate reductase
MGKEIEQIAIGRGHQIVSIIDIDNLEEFGSEAFRSADVAIEFTNPEAAYGNLTKAFEAGVKVVSGSTGWIDKHTADVEAYCTRGGKTLFWSSNFSLGVALFSAVNKYLARLMNDFPVYDVSMTEIHHTQKKDAPSGTAITLAEGILENLARKDRWVRETADAPDELAIHSVREGNVPGTHTICYASEADAILITHQANNRSGFALGAVLAAEYTAAHTGLLTMADLFPFLK